MNKTANPELFGKMNYFRSILKKKCPVNIHNGKRIKKAFYKLP